MRQTISETGYSKMASLLCKTKVINTIAIGSEELKPWTNHNFIESLKSDFSSLLLLSVLFSSESTI